MKMMAVEHISGNRLKELAISAEEFVEERMLNCLLRSILSGGRIEIVQGGQSDEEYADSFDEEANVFCFKKLQIEGTEERSDLTEPD